MHKIKYKITLSLIFLFCLFALFSAYFIQYVLGYQPCNLCLIERIPFIFAILIILFCLIFKKLEKITLIILSLIFFVAALISFYHFGIEQGFIIESFVCELNIRGDILTKEALLNELKRKTISCKDVTFKILGLSLATINIFVTLLLSAITTKHYLDYEKN
jgi:disulfide bond formation protein DsbB